MKKTREAFSLVEMVVAIGIFLVLGVGVTFFATGAYSSFTGTGNTRQAERFAADALQILQIIQERSWTVIDSNDNGDSVAETNSVKIDKDANGDWTLTSGSETRGVFTRYIYISTAERDAGGEIVASGGTDDPATKKVVVVVRASGRTDYKAESYLVNWDSYRIDQTSWSGATSTSFWVDNWTNWENQSSVDVPSSTGRLELTTTTIY